MLLVQPVLMLLGLCPTCCIDAAELSLAVAWIHVGRATVMAVE